MNPTEILKKNGYRKRYSDNHCIIYDLKEIDRVRPDTIIFHKNSCAISILTDDATERTHLGTLEFELTKDLLKAMYEKIEEIENNSK